MIGFTAKLSIGPYLAGGGASPPPNCKFNFTLKSIPYPIATFSLTNSTPRFSLTCPVWFVEDFLPCRVSL